MYSIILCCASLLSPSMMGTQRCRLKLTDDLSKALGVLWEPLVYALPRSVLEFFFKLLVFICMIFEQFSDVCIYILHSCPQRGESAPLWMFGATWRPQLFAVREFDFSEADKRNCQQRVWFGFSASKKSTATIRVMSIILPDLN